VTVATAVGVKVDQTSGVDWYSVASEEVVTRFAPESGVGS
jgi:hypothetical protein